MNKVEKAFELAKERYAEIGVDVDAALKKSRGRCDLASLLAGRRCRRV